MKKEYISRYREFNYNGKLTELYIGIDVFIELDGYDHNPIAYVEHVEVNKVRDLSGNNIDFNSIPWIVQRQIEKYIDGLDKREILHEIAETNQGAYEDEMERRGEELRERGMLW